MKREWTKEEIDTIKELWGTKTASDIGKIIGRTKNAVIGKMRRIRENGHVLKEPLKKPKKTVKPKEIKKPKTYYVAPKKEVKKDLSYSEIVKTPFGKPKTMQELDHKSCRWPVGEGKGVMFCGADRIKGKPYCEHHYKVSINKRSAEKYEKKKVDEE